jgi:hypothetical protein
MPDQQTLRGVVSNLKYIQQTGRSMRYTDKPEAATTVSFEVGGRAVAAMNTDFPPIKEGDDVEVVCAVNPRGGMEVGQLHNHTTGSDWQFSVRRATWKGLFK